MARAVLTTKVDPSSSVLASACQQLRARLAFDDLVPDAGNLLRVGDPVQQLHQPLGRLRPELQPCLPTQCGSPFSPAPSKPFAVRPLLQLFDTCVDHLRLL